jgi:hypothetical protein
MSTTEQLQVPLDNNNVIRDQNREVVEKESDNQQVAKESQKLNEELESQQQLGIALQNLLANMVRLIEFYLP